MSDQLPMKPSELKSFLKFEGSYNYSLKRFIDIGNFRASLLLHDNVLKKDVLGKIVSYYNEGEFIQWHHLHHENVILLLDMVPLSYQKTIFIFTFLERTLKTVVMDACFKLHPKCFNRKISYAKDVLSGLEYLHQKSLSLMNLDDEKVLICSQTDKAVISDLSCCTSVKVISKTNCPVVIGNLVPSEVHDGEFECMPFDVWKCGVMFLQMFTMHVLPWCQVLEIDCLEGLTKDLLIQTNPGSNLQDDTVNNLKIFLVPFLEKDPKLRVNTKSAIVSTFLHCSGKRIDEEARDFWKACETKNLSGEKFGEIGMYHGTGDIYGKRKDLNCVTTKKLSHSKYIKLKKSNSTNELYDIDRAESNAEVNSYDEDTFKYHSKQIHLLPNSLLKGISYSEDNLSDLYSRVYGRIFTTEGCNVKRKEREVKSKAESDLKFLDSMLKTTEEMERNLNTEDSYKLYPKQKCSEMSESTFDLPCHCIFCTGAIDQENPLKLIKTWPMPKNATKGVAHSSEQVSTARSSKTQGGFLHNNWESKRSKIRHRNYFDPIKENSLKQSNEKELENSSYMKNISHSEVLELLNASSYWHKNSEIPVQKVYPDNNCTSDENQLIFQRYTGFRNGLNVRMPLHYLPPMITTKSAVPKSLNEERSRMKKQAKPYRKIKHATNNETREVSCVKKETTSKNKKDFDDTDPIFVMETRSEENKVVDISMELPLCSESGEKEKSNKTVFRDKPKQKWIRVLCPGSVLEEKDNAYDIGIEK